MQASTCELKNINYLCKDHQSIFIEISLRILELHEVSLAKSKELSYAKTRDDF